MFFMDDGQKKRFLQGNFPVCFVRPTFGYRRLVVGSGTFVTSL